MAENIEIQCINKSDRPNPFERIVRVGGFHAGKRWSIPQERAVQGIESDEWSFHVTRGGRTVAVIVATSRYGHKYIKTVADGEHPDNLLSLPECPS